MSQYLNAELVNKKNGEVIALMSLSTRIRDMNDDDAFDKRYSVNRDEYDGAYRGDVYEGTVSVANIEAAINSKRNDIEKYEKKKRSAECMLVSAKTDKAYAMIHDDLAMYEELIEELNHDIESVSKLLVMIEYECSWKNFVRKEDEIDHHTGKKTGKIVDGYPMPRDIPMEDVELNLWLNC